MVKYALECQACGVAFEGWFSNSDAFDAQKTEGSLECPHCASNEIVKQIMAPSVRGTKKDTLTTGERKKLAEMAKNVREHIGKTHDYVGDNFADTARAMYYGEAEARPVWGETTPAEAKSLVEEGVPAMPLPAPFAPAKPADTKKLN